jgi:hypothetical protein
MTTAIVWDDDLGPEGIRRRIVEEFARLGIRSEAEAARIYGRPQQWVSRHMTGTSRWAVPDLRDFCDKLGMSYRYVVSGIRMLPTPSPDRREDIGKIIEFPSRAQHRFEAVSGDLGPINDDAASYVALSENLPLRRMDPIGGGVTVQPPG